MIVIDNHRILKRTIANIPQNPMLKAYARKNRFNMNFAEISFWMHVNKKKFYGLDFNRQFIIGNYIADFYIRSLGELKKFIVEHFAVENNGTASP